ncbi:hypothetical protein GCM10009846_07610 [Agrococcus versicolor]|uniref:Uncharacterized protein n=1 Tax=Agrococcus versicolor TaxID=501482 RepID=A0ABP5MF27_9MICO
MPDDDRDALTWEGDDADETLVTQDAQAPVAGAATQATAADAPSERVPGTRIVAVLFLLLAVASSVGWIAVMLANPAQQQTILALAMYQLGELLAVLAPVGWWLAARRLAPQPVPWWIAGVVVTAPWPLLVGVLA